MYAIKQYLWRSRTQTRSYGGASRSNFLKSIVPTLIIYANNDQNAAIIAYVNFFNKKFIYLYAIDMHIFIMLLLTNHL